jgi:hypothetical protein
MPLLKSMIAISVASAFIGLAQVALSQTPGPKPPPPPTSAQAAAQPPMPRTAPDNPRFRAFKTLNMWNLLILDSRTGRLWQAQYSLSNPPKRAIWPIQLIELASESGSNGRFSVTMTENMWNFILLDSETGAAWQCQFSVDGTDNRFCVSIQVEK